jgi:hypothetical protein
MCRAMYRFEFSTTKALAWGAYGNGPALRYRRPLPADILEGKREKRHSTVLAWKEGHVQGRVLLATV